MLTIQIKDGNNNVTAVINDIFSLQVDDEVNKGGKLKLRFPTEKWMQEKPVEKADRISVTYGLKIGQNIRLFDGYITDVTVKTSEVQIEAENWLSYLQRRMIRATKNYDGQTVSSIVSSLFSELNQTKALPFSLGKNDCGDVAVTKEFDVGTSFYDILKYCWESDNALIVRVYDGKLDVSKNTGNVLEGVWEYDVRNTRSTNIGDWSWKDSMDDFYSYIQNESGSAENSEFNNNKNLLFEKYEGESSLNLPSGKAIPSVVVSRDTDWWDFAPGDRKNIRLYTGYEWLPLEYLGLIQSRKVVINASGGIKAEVKISQEYKSETNILDLLLINLRKK